MKHALIAVALSFAVPAAFAQMGGMKGMDMQMDKKDAEAKVHKAAGVVTKVDPAKSRVTIKHGPVPTMNWPAMTMAFTVKDKALLDNMPVDKKVEFEFVQQGRDYVVTEVR